MLAKLFIMTPKTRAAEDWESQPAIKYLPVYPLPCLARDNHVLYFYIVLLTSQLLCQQICLGILLMFQKTDIPHFCKTKTTITTTTTKTSKFPSPETEPLPKDPVHCKSDFMFKLKMMSCSVSHPEEVWGHFQPGVWPTFLNSSWILLIYKLYCTLLATSFYLHKVFFWIEQKEANCWLEKFLRKQQFSFSFTHFWGHFFWCL